jgi:16S rRNA (adenine1518-N6/adenine1519-N6)-dimethyltransferase
LHKNKPYVPEDEKVFFRTIKGAFEQRRKTLPNALAAAFGELSKDEITAAIVSCGHSADIRGERLSVAEFVALSDELNRLIKAQ